MESIFVKFKVLNDPRDIRGKRHKLSDILIMTIYGVLCGFTDFVNIADFLKLKEEYFTQLLGLKNGTPSHDCLSRVFAIIDPKAFMRLFIEWIQEIVKEKGKYLAIDGKAIRSAIDKVNNGNVPYIVSAFLTDIGISVGEVKTDEKSNEIKAIPELLEILDIKDKIITIDAIGTQEKIVEKIIENKGTYVLKVKRNQEELLDDIKTYFDMEYSENNLNIAYSDTKYEKNHGRIEKRQYYLSYETDCISNKEKWKSVKAIGKVTVYRNENGKETITDNYYILGTKMTIDMFEKATRSHWNIETQLHWRLDVILDEDHSTNKQGNSIENLSIIRKIVFNLVRLDSSMGNNLTMRKKLTRYTLDFKNIENLVFNVIPYLDYKI